MKNRVQTLLDLLESDGRRIHVLLTRLTLCEKTAEDLMQELFLRVSRAEPFDRAEDPTAYVVRAAMNLAFDWRRKQQRKVETQILAAEPVDDGPSPTENLEHKEEFTRVLQALDNLSDLSRQVIVLHRLEGETYESIGQQLGKTPHQVRAICSKALGQLRELIGDSLSISKEKSQ